MSKDMLGIAVRKLVTLPSQILGIVCDLLEKISDPEWVEELKKFLRKEPCWSRIVQMFTAPEKKAVDILGHDKVAGYIATCEAWNIDPQEEPVVPFSEDVLKQCAEENKKKGADWRVVYIHGFSLRKQEEIRGRDRDNQPCFDPDYTWWLRSSEDEWGNQPAKPGYRLFDFSGRFGDKTHEEQDNLMIAETGFDDDRAEEQAVAEGCFTFYLLSGGRERERLLRNFWHRGRLVDSDGDHVGVGRFDEFGFGVSGCWGGYSGGCLRVVVSRK